MGNYGKTSFRLSLAILVSWSLAFVVGRLINDYSYTLFDPS